MKHIIILFFFCYSYFFADAQFDKLPVKKLSDIQQNKNKPAEDQSKPKTTQQSNPTQSATSVKDNLIQNGSSLLNQNNVNADHETMSKTVREMLTTASDRTVKKLGVTDGFFQDNTIKIDMPSDLTKVTSMLKKFGMGRLVDDAVLSMNRAAEAATAVCLDELISAIKQMSIQDARTILMSKDTGATAYMRGKCERSLSVRIKPIVDQSLEKVNATKYWDDVFSNYNKVSRNKINPDLSEYVNGKVMYALFYKIGQEETHIRQNPGEGAGKLINQILQRP